jgi:hypothetical protein
MIGVVMAGLTDLSGDRTARRSRNTIQLDGGNTADDRSGWQAGKVRKRLKRLCREMTLVRRAADRDTLV